MAESWRRKVGAFKSDPSTVGQQHSLEVHHVFAGIEV